MLGPLLAFAPVPGAAPGSIAQREEGKVSVRGYVEGYYGCLLEWSDRTAIVSALAALGLNAYAYAPKEDARHRLRWREPYEASWRGAFAAFCAEARDRGVDVIAGLAPGIDFDFASLDGGGDLDLATAKLAALREDGANRLMLLLDDIDADFERRAGGIASEGEAHARLANRLGERLDTALVVVPRIYAGELAVDAPDYLSDFAHALDARHAVSLCGRDIVAREVCPDDCRLPGEAGVRETILWDNLYANDYCPRRLFVGPWCGRRGIDAVLLNATGRPATDRLQLALMAAGMRDDEIGTSDAARAASARAVRVAHGVPPAFERLAEAFAHPTTNDRLDAHFPDVEATPAVLDALDELLWRWKTPLAREWYPQLFGLRQDLLLAADALPPDRVLKTQTPPLARMLGAGGPTAIVR